VTLDSTPTQTSRTAGVVAYGFATLLAGLTSIIVARTLEASAYGVYAADVAVMNAMSQVCILGMNYKVIRDVDRRELKIVMRYFLIIALVVTVFVGTLMSLVLGLSPAVGLAAMFVIAGQLLFVSLVRLARKNAALIAQVISAVVLLALTAALSMSGFFTGHRFLLLSSITFSVGVVVMLRKSWSHEVDQIRVLSRARLRTMLLSSVGLQFAYVPIPLAVAVLPGLASITFDAPVVSSLAISATFGTLYQALGYFLTNSVFVPNITNLREDDAPSSRFRHELVRQTLVIAAFGLLFIVATAVAGRFLIPIILGNSFDEAKEVVVWVAGLYVVQALTTVQTAYGMVCWPIEKLMKFQLSAVAAIISVVALALIIVETIQMLVLMTTIVHMLIFFVAWVINIRELPKQKVDEATEPRV
jgi:O-antigen/teichoic acid export membrane protein